MSDTMVSQEKRTAPLDRSAPDASQEDEIRAACGCVGAVLNRRGGQYPYVSVRIIVPCEGGHPGRVTAGVTERFVPNVVKPVAS